MMKYVNNYERFLEKRNFQNSLELLIERYGVLLESDEAAAIAPKESQSEKEILEEMPEDQKKKIEDILAKHFPETKGKLDVDKIPGEGEEGKKEGEESGEKKVEGEKTNEEGGILLAITIASLIPACMEAVGSLGNMLKQKFGINLDDKQMENLKKLNEGITALKNILNKKEGKFQKKSYNESNFKEISSTLSKELAQPDLEFGKGYEDHGHGAKHSEEKKVEEAAETEDTKALITKELEKYKKFRDKLFGSNFGNWLKEKGHALHHAYTAPIRGVLWTISLATKPGSKLRNEEVREKVANVIYCITMIGLAGYGIASSLSHLHGVSEVTGIILKGAEAGLNTSELRKQAITSILGAAA